MASKRHRDPGLETLLALDGEIFFLEGGYWTKIEARMVTPSENIPHGIRYSLTLHDSSRQRLLGYDNAHAFKPRSRKYAGQRREWDHRHHPGRVTHYEFENAAQLLQDFWNDVDRFLK